MSYKVNIINTTPDGNQTFTVTMTKGKCAPENGTIPAAAGGRDGIITLTVDDDGIGTITFSYGNVQVPLQKNMTTKNYTQQSLQVNPSNDEYTRDADPPENSVKVTRP